MCLQLLYILDKQTGVSDITTTAALMQPLCALQASSMEWTTVVLLLSLSHYDIYIIFVPSERATTWFAYNGGVG